MDMNIDIEMDIYIYIGVFEFRTDYKCKAQRP